MNPFTIYPAINLMDGQVIRLKQGDPTQKTIYSSEPELIARNWINAGANWLHVVDLDAAFGKQADLNQIAIKNILTLAKDNRTKIQLGGGIRSIEKIRQWLKVGVSRVVLGTIAVENPSLLKLAIQEFGGERILVGIDARDGWVHTHGWEVPQEIDAVSLAKSIKQIGVKIIIFTDISRDGIGGGVNLKSTLELSQNSKLDIIASGGIYSLQDVQAVKQAGISGVIIGRALYDGSVDSEDVFHLQEKEC